MELRDLRCFCAVADRGSVPQNLHMGLAVVWNPNNEGPILQDFLRLVRENKDRIQRTNGN